MVLHFVTGEVGSRVWKGVNMYLTSIKDRYNWGYQDGKNAAERNHLFRPAGILKRHTDKHFDAKYQEGYEVGYLEGRQSWKN